MKTKQWLVIPALLGICILIMSYFAYNQLVTSTTLSKKDIESRIAALYSGNVQTMTKNGSQYNVTFSVEDYIYEVVINEDYGTFEQLVLIKEGTPTADKPPALEVPEEPNETPDEPVQKPESTPKPQPAPTKPERLTEQQAIAIAKKQAVGTVEDIEFYPNANGGYYIVEIENDNDDGEDVTLQIHAITGKVLSVSFDD